MMRDGTASLLRRIAVLALAGFAASATARTPRLPEWVQNAIADAPAMTGVDGEVLLDQMDVTFRADGQRHTVVRRVFRINEMSARDLAVAKATYDAGSRKKPKMTGWMLPPKGKLKRYRSDDQVDEAQSSRPLAIEIRVRRLDASRDVQPGSVFAYEWETNERYIDSQFRWDFQDPYPVHRSRLTIAAPPGWTARTHTFNHAPVEPVVKNGRFVWELTELPAISSEPHGPGWNALSTRIGINFLPPAGASPGAVTAPTSWTDLSQKYSLIYEDKARATPAVAAQARKLIGGTTSTLEHIRRIGEFVQGFNYVSIEIDMGRGGGVIPHSADEVISCGYGDCKDKATLMRSLLGTVGIESYPLLTNLHDRSAVTREWPNDGDFNHCIIAIVLPPDEPAPKAAVVDESPVGRILIFDPTDPFTPPGSLSLQHQGGLGLLLAGSRGTLVEMPFEDPANNRVDRVVEGTLDPGGRLVAHLQETYVGAVAARQRWTRYRLPGTQFEAWVTERLVPSVGSVQLHELTAGNADDGTFRVGATLDAPAYARTIRDRFLIVKPTVLARLDSAGFTPDPNRAQPIHIEPTAVSDTTTLSLPPGFQVTELPSTVSLSQPWGEYHAECTFSEGRLHYQREFILRASILSADQYDAVCEFFQSVAKAEQRPALLERTPGSH